MTAWVLFDEEIERWRRLGREIEIWWRDDDAVNAGAALDRLLALRHRTSVPLALAVVPAHATAGLAERLLREPAEIDVLQHGYAHVNHASLSEKKVELGSHRPATMVLGEIGAGWLALERLFGARALNVLVPPWNRIAPGLLPALPEIGFVGLSTFGTRAKPEPARGLRQVNTHVDLIDWKGQHGFVGERAAVNALVNALAASRTTAGEPIGILSHHLAMDEEAWDFLDLLLQRTITTPGVKMLPARELFASREARV